LTTKRKEIKPGGSDSGSNSGPQRFVDGTPMTYDQELHEGYKLLPTGKFPTGLLSDIGSNLYGGVIKQANGTLTDNLDDCCFKYDQFWGAYEDLGHSYVTSSKFPTYETLIQTPINFPQDVRPLALAAIQYNSLDPNAYANGLIQVVDSSGNPVSPPTGPPSSQSPSGFTYVQETALGATNSYVDTNIFFGAGFFREKIFGDGDNNLELVIPSQFIFTNNAQGLPSTVGDIQIEFPDFALPNVPAGQFIPISPDVPYLLGMGGAPFVALSPASPVQVATIRMIVRATVDASVLFTCVTFQYYRPDDGRVRDCSPRTSQAFYPASGRPSWWPQPDWDAKPADPLSFFTMDPGDRPAYWPTSIPWPTLAAIYQIGPEYLYMGRWDTQRTDPTVTGPTYDATTGAVGQGPLSDVNKPGVLNVRLYPASYRSNESETERCKAKNLVVIVDGFDVDNSRTPDSIYAAFYYSIAKMRDKGYDTLLIDYVDGQDYIQRNGYALVEVLKDIPTRMHPNYELQRAIVVAGSMGTQTSRYALVKLEEQGVDHHTGLWVAVDGPFVGAHVSWSIQAFLEFMSDQSPTALIKLAGLRSPAARQMLRRGLTLQPDPESTKYYTEANALNGGTGLPSKLRKVAIASGSGRGHTQDGNLAGDLTPGPPYSFAHMNSITPARLWFGLDVDARTEEAGAVFFGWVRRPLLLGLEFCLFERNWNWTITQGAQSIDYTPGGYNTAPDSLVTGTNNAMRSKVDPGELMVSQLNRFSFMPTFSSLYYQGAQNTSSTVLQWTKLKSDVPSKITETWTTNQSGLDPWYGPEDTGLYPSSIDPNIKFKSPFDAIWYQDLSHEHVVNEGEAPPHGEDEFLFNELDRFTSQEEFTQRASAPSPRIQSNEAFLFEDITGYGLKEMFSVNTMTKKAMVQRLAGGTWQTIWESQGNMIGDWLIDKGDRFYLAELAAKPGDDVNNPETLELLSISAGTPARAEVQRLIYCAKVGTCTPSTPFWDKIWDNPGHGLGYLGPWKIHPTDMYAVGRFDMSGVRLLATYPYIGNEVRERTTPGTGGQSEAMLLHFSPGVLGGTYEWLQVWGNSGQPNRVGYWPIRFGDRYQSMRIIAGQSDYLFSANLLRDIFCCFQVPQDPTAYYSSAYLHNFADPGLNWLTQWNNRDDHTVGTWNLGDPEDEIYAADLDGDGIDELITANPTSFDVQNYDPSTGTWTQKYSTNGSPYVGAPFPHFLRSGDRYFFGNIDGDSKQEMLVINSDSANMQFSQAAIYKYDPLNAGALGFKLVWVDGSGSRMLGNWHLYER
jgi:hypothetical protein